MAIVIDFVRRLAPWIYGACALMALWYLRVVFLARLADYGVDTFRLTEEDLRGETRLA
mgnify:CR=1 FL=1